MCSRHGELHRLSFLGHAALVVIFRTAAAPCALSPALSFLSKNLVFQALCVLNVYTHRPLLPYGPLVRPAL